MLQTEPSGVVWNHGVGATTSSRSPTLARYWRTIRRDSAGGRKLGKKSTLPDSRRRGLLCRCDDHPAAAHPLRDGPPPTERIAASLPPSHRNHASASRRSAAIWQTANRAAKRPIAESKTGFALERKTFDLETHDEKIAYSVLFAAIALAVLVCLEQLDKSSQDAGRTIIAPGEDRPPRRFNRRGVTLAVHVNLKRRRRPLAETLMIWRLCRTVAGTLGCGLRPLGGSACSPPLERSWDSSAACCWGSRCKRMGGAVAWLLVLLKRPFRPGDRVQFPRLNMIGDVVDISTMYHPQSSWRKHRQRGARRAARPHPQRPLVQRGVDQLYRRSQRLFHARRSRRADHV